MRVAVRYCSKTPAHNTRKIAEAIADTLEVRAININDEPELKYDVDILFLGGAPYANIMAPELKDYVKRLTPDKVRYVVIFTTSNWSRRTVYGLKRILKNKHIEVADEFFYAHMLDIKNKIQPAKEFAERIVNDYSEKR